jgi:hypothetical protein
MPDKNTIRYTIRGVPPEVDKVLRERAAQSGQSLNTVVLEELVRMAARREKRADFSDVVGRWTPDPGFDEIIASQRQIDWDKWK